MSFGQSGFSFGQSNQAGSNQFQFGGSNAPSGFQQPNLSANLSFGGSDKNTSSSLFGTPASTNVFGSLNSQQSSGFSFGQSATPAAGQPASGFSFGQSNAPGVSGTPSQPTSGFSFGTPTGFGSSSSNTLVQPSAASTNLLGSSGNTQPAFGFGSTSQNAALSFGNATSPSTTSFGTPTTTASGFGFGPQTSTSFSVPSTAASSPFTAGSSAPVIPFGSSTSGSITSSAPFSFSNNNSMPLFGSAGGQANSPAPKNTVTFGPVVTINLTQGGMSNSSTTPSFSFGAMTSTTSSNANPISSSGISFGSATTTSSGNTSFGLGTPSTNPGNLNFLSATPVTSSNPTTGFSNASGPLSFGTSSTVSTATNSLTFGTPTTTTSTAGLSFGSTPTSLFGPTTTSVSTSLPGGTTTGASTFNFGSTVNTTSVVPLPTTSTLSFTPTTSLGLSLGSSIVPSTTSQPNLLFGTSQPSAGLSITAPSTSVPSLSSGLWSNSSSKPFQGLGGVAVSTTTDTTSGVTSGKPEGVHAVKETNVPASLLQNIQEFKKYVKDQKCTRDHITRMSSKPIYKVEEETLALKNLLMSMSSGIQRTVGTVRKLKEDTNSDLKNVEIAQRTKDTPPGLQYENTAPQLYFQLLIREFEFRMLSYKTQIEEMEKYIGALTSSSNVSSNDLNAIISRLHETFVALAAQLQVVHEGVEKQKEHYLLFRKTFTGDTTDIFDLKQPSDYQPKSLLTNRCFNAVTVGPTPFTSSANLTMMAMNNILQQTRQPSGPPVLGLGATPSAFPLSTTQNSASPFQNTGLNFGTGNQSLNLGVGKTGFGLGAGISLPEVNSFGSQQPLENPNFMLQKPPVGNKRGKRN